MRLIPLGILALGAATAFAQQSTASDWTYYGKRGPEHWGRLSPAYAACSNGKQQSPIDIRGVKVDPALKPIEFHYLAGPVTITNTGHTIRVDVAPGSYIVANGIRYDLIEFHFHHPGEDAVNGKLADFEANLLHKGSSGEIAVIEVRMNEGVVNGLLASLWPSLPRQPGSSAKLSDDINPAGLFPADKSYYTYIGSITVPPCTEGVHWFVMKQETTLSGEQLQNFSNLYPDNARRLQAIHGRKVTASP